MMAVIAGRGDC